MYCRAAEESGNPLLGLHATKELITNKDTFPAAVDFTDFNPYVLAANVAKKRGSEPNLKNFRHHVAVIITKTYLQTLGIELESDRKTRADIALRDFYFKFFKAQDINLDEASLTDQKKHLSTFLLEFCKPLGFNPTLALSRLNRYILDFPGLDSTPAAESKAKEVTAKVVKETDRIVEQAKGVGERVGRELERFFKKL